MQREALSLKELWAKQEGRLFPTKLRLDQKLNQPKQEEVKNGSASK